MSAPEETMEEARERAAHNAVAQAHWGAGGDVAWAPNPSEEYALVTGIPAFGVGWFKPASPELTPELYFWSGGWAWLRRDERLIRDEDWSTKADVEAWAKENPSNAQAGRVIWAQEGRKP